MARTVAPETAIQTAVYQIEVGPGRKIMYGILLLLLAGAVSLIYTSQQFRGFNKRESMDMAQVARNIAQGRGYTTFLIRPLSLWQLEQHGWNVQDPDTCRHLIIYHPDICNPPLYPMVLGAIFRLLPPKAFGYDQADYISYAERWVILPFNQLCLFACLALTFAWAKQLFDRRVALMATWLMFFSDTLWSYGISGLPTNLLMLLLMLAVYCLYRADRRFNPVERSEGAPVGPAAAPGRGRVMAWALTGAVLLGLCFLTRYAAGFLLLPMLVYVMRIFRRWAGVIWAAVYLVVFAVVITPWLVRIQRMSGSPVGIAQYELVNRSGGFQGETLPRSYKPDFKGAYSFGALSTKFLINARTVLSKDIRIIGTDFLVFFFAVGVLFGFRRRDVSRLRGLLLGLIVMAVLAMCLIGSDPERSGPDVNGGNLLVLFLPIVAIYGTAFFFLLLDRVPFRIKLTRVVAISGFVALNVAPIIFSLLPPHPTMFPYPPYMAPVARAVGEQFELDALACSDLPWEIAWNGERRVVWLPMTLNDFYEIHDFIAPKGFQYLYMTPYLMDARPQSDVARGEFKGWETFLRGQLPVSFPLKAYSPLPPDNQQILLADRARWAGQKTVPTTVQSNPLTIPSLTNRPAASSPTNRPAAPPAKPK
jgi:4-amino-4-deoxy-L-arabinose transferase-like glycosyltransferase